MDLTLEGRAVYDLLNSTCISWGIAPPRKSEFIRVRPFQKEPKLVTVPCCVRNLTYDLKDPSVPLYNPNTYMVLYAFVDANYKGDLEDVKRALGKVI